VVFTEQHGRPFLCDRHGGGAAILPDVAAASVDSGHRLPGASGVDLRPGSRLIGMIKCPGCGEENPPKFRLCGYCGTPLAVAVAAPPPHEVRKTVTIVFSDLKGSTALGEQIDSEA
jgi:hypothetical protein